MFKNFLTGVLQGAKKSILESYRKGTQGNKLKRVFIWLLLIIEMFTLLSILSVMSYITIIAWVHLNAHPTIITMLGILISTIIYRRSTKNQIFWNLYTRLTQITAEISKLDIQYQQKNLVLLFKKDENEEDHFKNYETQNNLFYNWSILKGNNKIFATYSQLFSQLESVLRVLDEERLYKGDNKKVLLSTLASVFNTVTQYGSIGYELFHKDRHLLKNLEIFLEKSFGKDVISSGVNTIYLQPHEDFLDLLQKRLDHFIDLEEKHLVSHKIREQQKRFWEIVYYYKAFYGNSERWIKDSDPEEFKQKGKELDEKMESIRKNTVLLFQEHGFSTQEIEAFENSLYKQMSD